MNNPIHVISWEKQEYRYKEWTSNCHMLDLGEEANNKGSVQGNSVGY